MDDNGFDPETLAAVMGRLVGLEVRPSDLKGVTLHLRNTQRIARPMLRAPIPERIENAPVFRP